MWPSRLHPTFSQIAFVFKATLHNYWPTFTSNHFSGLLIISCYAMLLGEHPRRRCTLSHIAHQQLSLILVKLVHDLWRKFYLALPLMISGCSPLTVIFMGFPKLTCAGMSEWGCRWTLCKIHQIHHLKRQIKPEMLWTFRLFILLLELIVL